MIKSNESVLVIFTSDLPKQRLKWWQQFDTVIAPKKLKEKITKNVKFKNIEELLEAGSIYEASNFEEELSRLNLPDGTPISKSFIYKGYELWWMGYNRLFIYTCLPYTQHKKLLKYLKSFQVVYLYKVPYIDLYFSYLQAHGCKTRFHQNEGIKIIPQLPFGIFIQITVTFFSIPLLMMQRKPYLIFVGDKFDKSKDYDFRMKYIYQELRGRQLQFVEFIRSLEPWRKVLNHIFRRKRPVIYSEAVIFLGKLTSFVTGGSRRAFKEFGYNGFVTEKDPERRFKLLVASRYLLHIHDEIWGIRIMKWLTRVIGIKSAFFAAATDRNYQSVLGCKLNNIPTVGILHGVASKYYNRYEFLPGYEGKKSLSVDKYGLWSKWWKEYFSKESDAYKSEQLFVSGPMRPLKIKNQPKSSTHIAPKKNVPIKVLFVPGELTSPEEIMPFLMKLKDAKEMEVSLTFRPYRDSFENWLNENDPRFFDRFGRSNILLGDIHHAIKKNDVVVGTYSTAALEALLQLKPMVFFRTAKWGDYYTIKKYDKDHSFFAENPEELIEKIKNVQSISIDILKDLQERYFGNPYENGSKWVVDQLVNVKK